MAPRSKPARPTSTARTDSAPAKSPHLNPNRPVTRSAFTREDGWQSTLTGIGSTTRDKRLAATFKRLDVDRTTAEELWRGDDMAARIIESVPDEMLREGFCISVTSPEVDDALDPIAPDAIAGGEGDDGATLPGENDPTEPVDPNAPDETDPTQPDGGAAPEGDPGAPSDKPPTDAPPDDETKRKPFGKRDARLDFGGGPFGKGGGFGGRPSGPSGSPPPFGKGGKPGAEGNDPSAPPFLAPPPPPKPGPINIDDTGKQIGEDVDAALEELGALEAFSEALKNERAFGGSGILIGADDGQTDLTQPLKLDSIRSVKWLTVLTPRELQPCSWYADPAAPKFGEPEVYRLTPDTPPTANTGTSKTSNTKPSVKTQLVEVHESRLILFKGIKVSRAQMRSNGGWGDSVLGRVVAVLRDFHMGWNASAILLHDFSQAVVKIKDLAELFETQQDDVVVKRIQAIDMSRSVARAVIIDAEEEYERKQTPVTGLAELLDRFCNRLAAASGIPVTLLMGQAPAGLNATGAADVRGYYDKIKSLQTKQLGPKIEHLTRLIMLSKEGPTQGVEPETWSVKFPPLWQLTETEQATIRKTQADTDNIYLTQGVLTPEEVAASRFGGDKYSTETVIDIAGRQRMAALPSANPFDPNAPPDPNNPKPPPFGKKGKPPKPGAPPVDPSKAPPKAGAPAPTNDPTNAPGLQGGKPQPGGVGAPAPAQSSAIESLTPEERKTFDAQSKDPQWLAQAASDKGAQLVGDKLAAAARERLAAGKTGAA